MKIRWSTCLILLSLFSNFLQSHPANANSNGSLTVELEGLKNQTGQVCLSLFSSHQGFPDSKENAVQSQCVQLDENRSPITFDNLSPGSYAVAIFHDANRDQILNVNRLGIPTEGFGFSRNPTLLSGIPRFEDTAVPVKIASNTIQIKFQYLWNLNP